MEKSVPMPNRTATTGQMGQPVYEIRGGHDWGDEQPLN